jgi:hypothetical protein
LAKQEKVTCRRATPGEPRFKSKSNSGKSAPSQALRRSISRDHIAILHAIAAKPSSFLPLCPAIIRKRQIRFAEYSLTVRLQQVENAIAG